MESSKKIYVGIGVFVVLILVLVVVWMNLRKEEVVLDTVIQEITVTKDDTSLTLARTGTLTIRNKYGVFQQQWDDAKVAEFFARLDSTDFSKYSNQCKEGEYCVSLTLGNGNQVNYSIAEFDLDIPDVVQDLIEDLEELGDVIPSPTPTLTETVSPTPTPISGGNPTPTMTPQPSPIPTPTGGGQGGGGGTTPPSSGEELPDYYIPFECEFFNLGDGSEVLSETVCDPR